MSCCSQKTCVILVVLVLCWATVSVRASSRFQISDSLLQNNTKQVFLDEISSEDVCPHEYERAGLLFYRMKFSREVSTSRLEKETGKNGRFFRDKKEPICLLAHKQEFDYNISKLMADFSSIAYCSNHSLFSLWGCDRCQIIPEFLVARYLWNEEWDTSGYAGYYPPLNAKVVAFKGTDSDDLKNWMENLQFTKHMIRLDIDFPGFSDIRVHNGFSKTWAFGLRDDMLEAVNDLINRYGAEGPLYITGHSSGAAFAQLAAFTFKALLDLPDIRLYTFGSPRVGNDKFASTLPKMVTEIWRFTHDRDMVPSLPWTTFGYWHVPQEVFQQENVDDEDIPAIVYRDDISNYRVCDGTGEDSNCHNAECMAGFICGSVDEHYYYLGTVMSDDGTC